MPLPETSKTLFSVSKAAKYLGISTITLRRWDKEGKLKAHRTLGNSRRYSKDFLDKFIFQQKSHNDISNKRELDISEAAAILGVTTKTLRNWEKEGKISSLRDKHNYRVYDKSTIVNFTKITEKVDHLLEPLINKVGELERTTTADSFLGKLLSAKEFAKAKYKLAHFHIKKTHLFLGVRFHWYSKWHRFKYHPHIHWAALSIYFIGVISGVYLALSGGLGFPIFASGELTDTWDFSVPGNYTLSDANLIEVSGNNARLKTQNYSSDANTQLLLHLDESSGNPSDSSSYANTATNTSGTYASGNLNNAITLNGTSAQISIASSASLNLSQNNTIEAWTKFTSSFSSTSHSQQQGIVDKGAYKLYYDNETGKVVYELANSSPTWTQKGGPNIDGGVFNSVENSWDVNSKPIITNQVEMGGDIYVGLGNGTSDAEVWRCDNCTTSPVWNQVGGDGLYSSWADGTYEEVTSLATDGTVLYVGIGLTTNDAEVWRCSSCGGTPNWGGARIAGKGTNSTWNTSYETVSSMVVSSTTLVVGVGNNAANEAEVWRCTSCDSSPSWSKIGGDGVNSSWNTSYENVPSMVLMGSNVVVGLGSTAGDGEVWRCTTNCLSGTPTWAKLGGDSTATGDDSWASTYEQIISLTFSSNVLYVGTGTTPANEADVWRCADVTTCTITSGWSQVGGDALNSSWAASTYETVRSLVASGTTVYAGIGDTSGEAEVWKCTTCDGTPAWSKIGEGGTGVPPQSWTTPFTYAHSLLLSGTTLFVGVSNAASSSSAELWSCDTGGTCNATTGWSKIGGDYINKSWGFYNLQAAESMTTGNGNLYVGTGNTVAGNALVWQYNGTTWTHIGGQGVNSSWPFSTYENVTSLISLNGKIYAGLGTTAGDAEVWEWDGAAWTQIGGTASGNWGNGAVYETVPSMTVLGGILYAGIGNSAANEAEVWRWTSGTTWTKVGGDATGSSWNTSYETVNSLGVYNGKLVAGIGASAGDAEVWSCTTCEGTPSWVKIGGDASGASGQSWVTAVYEQVESMSVYNNDLYVGLGTGAGEAEVWKCTGSCTTTTGWTLVGGDAVNSSWADVTYERVRTMKVYNGKLYAGLGTTAAEGEVWEWDGTTWAKIGGDGAGWTTGNNIENIPSMSVYKGKLYTGLGDTANADSMIWAYGNNGYLESAATSQNTNWHHVAATYDGTTMKIFIDSDTANSSVVASGINIPTISIPLLVGTTYGNPNQGKNQGYFAGSIDELRISNIARSSFNNSPYSAAAQTVRPAAAVRIYGAAAWDNFNPTEILNGGTINYRLSSDGGTIWKYYNSGWVTSSSISEVNSGAVIDTNIPTFPVTNGGLMWQAILDGDGTQQVTLDQVFVDATHDITAPSPNAANIVMKKINGGATLNSNDWTNGSTPYFSWDAASDAQSGIKGYCLYIGQTGSSDPVTTKGNFTGSSPVTMPSPAPCQYLISTAYVDLATYAATLTSSSSPYYLNVKAVDVAGNVFATSAQFQFRYDNTLPSNPAFVSPPGGFVASYSVTTTWPTSGGNEAADSHSGFAGLQYRISSSGTWYGEGHSGTQDLTDLLTNDGAYTTQTNPDHDGVGTDELIEGNNTIYFRTWDNAGNVTTTYTTGVIKINTSSPSAPQNVVATPTTNTANSFAFSWAVPATYQGSASNITYCYTINTLPSSGSCTFTAGGVTSLSAGAYANQPGDNTFYVVAKDEALNINYSTYATVTFTANTSAPGIPLNIDIADISVKATSNWRLAVTWEPPTNVGAGVANYKVDRSLDNISYSQTAITSGTSYVDTGLTTIRYYYKVKACDSANNCGAVTGQVNEIPTGKFTSPATLTAQPKTTAIGTKTVTINWGTDRTADSRIALGTVSGTYSASEISSSNQVTDHNITIDNLTAGTTYYYKAKWTDEDGNQGVSTEKTFSTLPPPTASEVETKSINLTQGTVKFTVKDATKVNILFGKSSEFGGLKTVFTSTAENTQTTELTGLDDGTKYFYTLKLFDSEGNEYPTTVTTFSTLPRPKISNLRFDGVTGEPTSTQKVSWTTNVPTTSVANYTPEKGVEVQNFNAELKLEHEVILRELADDTEYTISVSGRDSLGNLATSDENKFRTALDTRAPKVTELTVETAIQGSGGNSKGQLIVSWKTDEPASSQIEYGEGTGGSYSSKTVEDNNLVTDHVVIISELSPSKTYHLRSVSRDKANNSGNSDDNTAITGRASENILDIILSSIQRSLGFLGNPFGGFR